MISLHCTKCKALLEMDDGFAGGVCRCQYCKTIQTVPAKGKDKLPAGKPASGKSTPAPMSSGLDELAEIVASSGLARGGLRKRPAEKIETPVSEPEPAKSKMLVPALVGAGVLVIVLVGVVIYLVTRPTPASSPSPTPSTPVVTGPKANESPQPPPAPIGEPPPEVTKPAPIAAIAGPSFANVALPSGPVVYLIDQSQSNEEFLDAVKLAAFKSIRSLGADRRFQIVFWKRESEPLVSYPDAGLAVASASEVEAATKRFEDIVPYGSTDLTPALQRAIAAAPEAIVLTTAKSFLGEEFLVAVQKATAARKVKIHTFALGDSDIPILKQVAEETGGTYHAISSQQLQSISK